MSSFQKFVAVDQGISVVNSEECLCLIFWFFFQNIDRSHPFKLGKEKEMLCVGIGYEHIYSLYSFTLS